MIKFSIFGIHFSISKTVVDSSIKPRIKQEIKDEIVRLKLDGNTNSDVAFLTNVSESSVTRIFNKYREENEQSKKQ